MGSEVTGEHPHLCETNSEVRRYTTLSHRWPKVLHARTMSKNIEAHRKGIPLSSLPKTFQDTIIACRALGVLYL